MLSSLYNQETAVLRLGPFQGPLVGSVWQIDLASVLRGMHKCEESIFVILDFNGYFLPSFLYRFWEVS